MLDCNFSGFKIINEYTCLAYDHPYYSFWIISLLSVIGVIIWFVKSQMPRDGEGKKGLLSEFFSILGDVMNGFK